MVSRRPQQSVAETLFELFRVLFAVGATTCLLSAVHRIAAAMKMGARIEVLERMGEAFTDDEREILVHKVRSRALGGL